MYSQGRRKAHPRIAKLVKAALSEGSSPTALARNEPIAMWQVIELAEELRSEGHEVKLPAPGRKPEMNRDLAEKMIMQGRPYRLIEEETGIAYATLRSYRHRLKKAGHIEKEA